MSEEENQTDNPEKGAGEDPIAAAESTEPVQEDPSSTAESAEPAQENSAQQRDPKSESPTNQISESDKPDTAEIIAKSISGKDVNIDALLKVPVSLAIEVGRTKLNLNDLLSTREGSVIELDRHLDEPLDILVNGALIAHGIVVLANEKFGLQITDIISLEERARSL